MAHDLEQMANGKYRMFCVGDEGSAWHHLGQRAQGAVTAEQAIELSGLDWPVLAQKMYARNPVTEKVEEVKGFKQIWRGGADPRQLGVVGEGYEIIQNRRTFSWMDSVIGKMNGAHYESAGFLNSGKLWILARIPGADIRVGRSDNSLSYLLSSTTHDGSGSWLSKLCSERVVCKNTLDVALGEQTTTVRIKHTKSAEIRLQASERFALSICKDAKELETRLNFLASRKMTRETTEQIFARLFPVADSAKSSTRRDNVVARVLELYDANNGNAFPEQRGTAFNLLNAVTEYVDWERGIRQTDVTSDMNEMQIRKASALFGSGSQFKAQALDAILELTKNAPAAFSLAA